MNLKSVLKAIKLNESTISMALGVFVILAIGALVLNYFKTQRAGTTFPNSASITNEEPTLNNNQNEHVVVKGESLWKIAKKYYNDGFKWTEIAKANDIKNPGAINEGQKLTIPDVQQQEVVSTTTTSPSNPADANSNKPTNENKQVAADSLAETDSKITDATYTVEKGDNLWDIAIRAYGDGYKWTEIAKANNLVHPGIIHSGNVLQLPR